MMMNEPSEDKSPSNRVIIDVPIAEKTAMSGSAKEKDSADGSLRLSVRRRWSDARSLPSGRSTAAKLKAQLNPNYPLQASLHALVDYAADLDAKIGLRKRLSTARTQMRFALLSLCIFLFANLMQISYPAALRALFCIPTLYACIYVYQRKPVELEHTSEMAKLQNFESIIVETLGHR